MRTLPGEVLRRLTARELREEKIRQEIRKLSAQAEQAETELATARGELYVADDIDEKVIWIAGVTRQAVQSLPKQVISRAMAAGLPHFAAPALEAEIQAMIDAALRTLAEYAGQGRKQRRSPRARQDGDAQETSADE